MFDIRSEPQLDAHDWLAGIFNRPKLGDGST